MVTMVPLCPLDSLAEGEITQAQLPDGTKLALYNVGGAIYATDDKCTHGEVSLSEEGSLMGTTVECSFHFGCFDVTTGKATAMPCERDLRAYPVTIIDGTVHVGL